MRKTNLVNEYPYNLYESIYAMDDDIKTAEELISSADNDDRFQKIPVLIKHLTLKDERTADILLKRTRDHKSFSEISQIYGISPSRASEIFRKGCRMMRRYYTLYQDMARRSITDDSPIDVLKINETVVYKLSCYGIESVKDLLEWIMHSDTLMVTTFSKDEINNLFISIERAELLNEALNECWKKSIDRIPRSTSIESLLDSGKICRNLLMYYHISTVNQLVDYIKENGFYFIDFTVNDCFYIFHKFNLYGICDETITEKFLEVCKLSSAELKDRSKKKMKMEENKK